MTDDSTLLFHTLQSMQRELQEIKSTQKLNTKTWVRCAQMAEIVGLHASTLRKKAQFKMLPEGAVRIRERGQDQHEYLFHIEKTVEALCAGKPY